MCNGKVCSCQIKCKNCDEKLKNGILIDGYNKNVSYELDKSNNDNILIIKLDGVEVSREETTLEEYNRLIK